MNHTAEIEVLDGVDAVRKRPGMYVGDAHDGSGLHHLFWEVLGNSIDQHLARRARRVRIDIDGEWVTIEDDGLGIPAPILEPVLTRYHACGSWDDHVPHVHVGESHVGVGLFAVNALSARFEIESRCEGRTWSMAFERGRVVQPLACMGAASQSGTRIRFHPDAEIFSTAKLDVLRVETWLEQLAWRHPLLEVRFRGSMLDNREGLRGWVRSIASNEQVAPIVSATRAIDDVFVDIALGWTNRPEGNLRAFVNDQTIPRGTHVQGMWAGIARATGYKRAHVTARLEPGLVGVLAVTMGTPEYAGEIRDKLKSAAAHTAVSRTVLELLRRALSHGALRDLFARRLAPDAPDSWHRKAA
jgi:DNA gyrase subunit B